LIYAFSLALLVITCPSKKPETCKKVIDVYIRPFKKNDEQRCRQTIRDSFQQHYLAKNLSHGFEVFNSCIFHQTLTRKKHP
jgi:hypothetical protein